MSWLVASPHVVHKYLILNEIEAHFGSDPELVHLVPSFGRKALEDTRYGQLLRISHERLTAKEVLLVVEGELLGPWVGELERTCEPFLGNGRRLVLNVSQVGFADRAGVDLLKSLARRGAGLVCSTFLNELLRQPAAQGPEDPTSSDHGEPGPR